VVVLAVISGADRRRLTSFNKDFKTSYTILADPQDIVRKQYGAPKNPTTLIIDKEGTVRYVGGFTQWMTLEDKIESIRAVEEGKSLTTLDFSTVEKAVKALKDDRRYMRFKAARALAEMKDKSAIPALIEALNDEAANVRASAAEALGNIGDKSASEALLKAIDDESVFVRLEVVKAFGSIKDKGAIPSLVKSLKNGELRESAANSLADIREPLLVAKSLETTEQPAEAYAQLGRAYFERSMYEEALPAYKKAIELISELYRKREYVKNLATCHAYTGKDNIAVAEYLQLIKISSTGITSRSYWPDGRMELYSEREIATEEILGIYEKQNNLAKLMAVLVEKVREFPEDAAIYELLGRVYDKQRMYSEAIEAYEKVIKLDRDNTSAYGELAVAYSRIGKMKEAAAAAKEMSKRISQDAVWYGKLANVYQECGMYDEAQVAYKGAIKLAPLFSYERRTYKKALERCDKGTRK